MLAKIKASFLLISFVTIFDTSFVNIFVTDSGNFKSLIERISFLAYSAHVWRVKKFDSLVRLISFFTFVSGRKSLEIENSNSWHYHRSFLLTSLTLVYLLYDSTQTILPYISEQYLHLWQILTLS